MPKKTDEDLFASRSLVHRFSRDDVSVEVQAEESTPGGNAPNTKKHVDGKE